MSLRKFPIELLERPTGDRVAYFRERIVQHPRLVETYERVLRAIREPASAALISVFGPSGVGKTTLRLLVQKSLTEALRAQLEEDPGRLPVVGVEAIAGESADFNWRDFYKRLLRAMDEPLIDQKVLYPMPGVSLLASRRSRVTDRSAASELRYAVEQAFRYRRPVAVLIDEAQHFKKVGSARRLQDQLDTVKSLASTTGIVHVLLGTDEMRTVTGLSGQLNRRTIDIPFGRYHADQAGDVRAFQSIVLFLQERLPLPEAPDLVAWWEELYEGSVGCVGVLKDWLTKALAMVLEKGATTLTRNDLETQALSKAKLIQMAREIKEGERHLIGDEETRNDLRRLLGMGSDGVVGGVEALKATAWHSAVGNGRRPVRRVGEQNPVRDAVGAARNGG